VPEPLLQFVGEKDPGVLIPVSPLALPMSFGIHSAICPELEAFKRTLEIPRYLNGTCSRTARLELFCTRSGFGSLSG
jgi:hypothetical protein